MSKPDSASGSLESILASIRESLSEQSTDALNEEPAAVPAKEAQTRKAGLTQRLAGAGAETPAAAKDGGKAQPIDDLADLLDEPLPGPAANATPAPPAAAVAAAPAAAAPKEDPLWFLTRTPETPPETDLPPAGAVAPPPDAAAKVPPAEPVLTRPEVLRASMPPFFGSTAEAAEIKAAQAAKVADASPPQAAPPLFGTAARPAPPAAPLRNGKAEAAPEPPQAAQSATDPAPTGGLETAVLDLLKPMMRQWLDQNMPRLVAEALKEEAVARAQAARDGKKT